MKRAFQIPWYAQGGSGKIGDVVYYNRYGKTLLRKAAGGYNKNPTAKQAAVRERFIAAHLFGKSVIAEPALKALYQEKANGKCTAYAKAVSEFMKQSNPVD